MLLRLTKEMAEADTVHAADSVESWEGGYHAIGFKLREKRTRQSGLGREPSQGEVFGGTQCAEFHTDRIDRYRISGRSSGHLVRVPVPQRDTLKVFQ